ncbi:MAG TPA: hypothetical protein VFC78_12750, partial [Tepidisphaeraceae bacterium]|nr:hypothetical protein [Tepidisphaeraceae bacterium]
DEIAVAATERMTYVCALEQVARFTLGLPQPDYFNGLAVAFGGQRPDLLHRIKHLLEMPTPRSRNNWPAGALAIAVLVVSVGVSRSAGQKGQSSTTGAPADAPAPSAPSDHASDGATISNPTSREGHDATAKENALLTPVEEAAKEARAQAVRNEERAELDVKEAELTLDAKRMDFARLEAARVRHGVAQTEVDNAKLAVSLGDIQLQRAKLALADAHAKTQSLVTSEVKITLRSDLGNRDGWFSIKGRDVTLRQLLNQEEKKIAAFEKKGEGQVTLYRVIDGSLHKFLDGAPLADVMSGKGKNPALKPGDEVTVKFDSRVAKNVTFRVFVPGQRQPPGGSWQELPERNMTLTQVLAASNYDVKALANQPVTLIRKGKDGNDEKVLDNVPLGRLIDGKVKDEIIVSGDTIQVGDNSPAARETPEGANKRVGK